MEPQEMGGWVLRNPCDHRIDTPYFVGHLAAAASECTRACPTTTYADNSQVCHACPVVGCSTCRGEDGCEDCLIFHFLTSEGENGRCLYVFGGIFMAATLFFLLCLLFGAFRFCCLALASPQSPAVLKEALAHRRRAKARDYTLPGNPFFPYDDTDVRWQRVSGLGPVLFFRFVAFTVVVAFLLVIGLLAGYFLPQLTEEGVFLPRVIPLAQLGLARILHAVAMYVLCLFVMLRWVFTQDRIVKADTEEEPLLQHYALVAQGFPKSARSPHEVKGYFEAVLGFELEGVSIAYDHYEEAEFISDRIARTVEKADTHLGVYAAELSGLESSVGDDQDSYVLDCVMCSGCAFVVFSREEDREFCLRRFAEIDRQVRQGFRRGAEDSKEDDGEEFQALLATPGPNSGPAQQGVGPPPVGGRSALFRGKFPIRVLPAPEPCGLLWHHFAVRRRSRIVRMGATLLGALLLAAVVGAVVYAPAVLYEVSYSDAMQQPHREQLQLAILEQSVVAASIAVGNQFLVAMLKHAGERSGFVEKASADSAFAACACLTLVINSVASLAIVAVVANSESLAVTRTLAAGWLFQVLWTGMLVTEVVRCALPVWSYWTSYFWVRQSRYLSVREAEPSLTTPEFPFATRYVDLLHAFTITVLMVVCDCTSLYTIGAASLLLLYSIYVYFVDKYLLLRLHRQTYYASARLDAAAHYLLAVPISALAALPLQYADFGTRWWLTIVAGVGGFALLMGLVRISQACAAPKRTLSDVPYVEVASLTPCNFFNTNHAHVLRTLHFPSIVVPPIYPFLPGKEYLQGGQFADYDDGIRLRDTLMWLAKGPLKGFDDVGNPQDFA